MASTHLAEQVGRVLDGRYRVVAPIGNGASAAVFLADDVVLRRRVAIKVLHAALANDQAFLKRFQAEAHTAAGLSHPNIMRVLDWGEADDAPFLVLEYLGGGSLRSVLDHSDTLTVSQAVSVGLQAARALDYAHRRGLVHRDIKPANLLFDDEGRMAIADFGLARALAEAAMTEPGGAMLGTARYASPEQVRGRFLDGKSDVYALGLVLIEAVSGYVPFTADTTLATLMARLDAQLEAPEEMGPLGPIVEQATNPDPDARIDASTMVSLLEEAAAQLPAPEPVRLPGAVAIDLINADGVDRTMLPPVGSVAPAAPVTQAVPAVATPLNGDEGVTKKRFMPLRRNNNEPEVAAAPVAAPLAVDAERNTKKRRRPSLKAGLIGLLVAALILASSSAGYAIYYYTGSERPVPTLTAMTVDEARAAAKQANVKLAVDGEDFSEDVPVGLTLNQVPAPGGKVHPREPVHLKVSKGPAPRPVDNVVNQNIEAAKATLGAKGFNVTTEDKDSETVAKGTVLDQNPKDGELAKGAEVHLVVSGGPKPRVIPDLAGGTYDAAVASLNQLQLKVNRTEDYSNDVPAGQVAGTSPKAGASVGRDSTVNVIISKGPDLIQVPSVNGVSATVAAQRLTAAGLSVANVYGPPTGTVFLTNPGAGTSVKRGTSISLYTQ